MQYEGRRDIALKFTMRLMSVRMSSLKQLDSCIEALNGLSYEDLKERAILLEKQKFQLENMVRKLNKVDVKIDRKRSFNFDRFKKRHVALQLAYLGWDYSGLVVQKHVPLTVMEKLLDALEKCALMDDRNAHEISVCGRTDKGVSAMGQVVSLVLRSSLLDGIGVIKESGSCVADRKSESTSEIDYVFLVNKVLPRDIRILAWSAVDEHFDARHSCSSRSYTYFFPRAGLDVELMNIAAKQLIGMHDFRNFCVPRVNDDSTTFVRQIYDVEFILPNSEDSNMKLSSALCSVRISASGFLYHQIRCILTILFLVGRGLEEPSIITDLLDLTKTPSKPQYQMSADIPLLFTKSTYPESALYWQTSQEAQIDLVKHFQKLWTEYGIKSSIVKTMLDHVEERFGIVPKVNHHLDFICPEARWRQSNPGTKGSHRRLNKRTLEPSVEDKMEKARKKNKLKQQLDQTASPTTSSDP